MFKLVSSRQCRATYGQLFDEYLQICTVGWNNNNQMPCEGNEGSGLIIGWPQEPRLIGIFSSPLKCGSDMPAVYVKLLQYEKWIDQTIGGRLTTTWPTTPTVPTTSPITTTPSPPPSTTSSQPPPTTPTQTTSTASPPTTSPPPPPTTPSSPPTTLSPTTTPPPSSISLPPLTTPSP